MYAIQRFAILIALLSFGVASRMIEHSLRTYAQTRPATYEIMLTVDVFGFTAAGGDAIGYNNYFKWSYATWRKSPERTLLQRVLFWDRGILYDASDPPEEYRYPPRFAQTG